MFPKKLAGSSIDSKSNMISIIPHNNWVIMRCHKFVELFMRRKTLFLGMVCIRVHLLLEVCPLRASTVGANAWLNKNDWHYPCPKAPLLLHDVRIQSKTHKKSCPKHDRIYYVWQSWIDKHYLEAPNQLVHILESFWNNRNSQFLVKILALACLKHCISYDSARFG